MTIRNLLVAAAVAVTTSGTALAKSQTSSSAPIEPLRASRTLAGDIQVVNPAAPAATPVQAPPAAVAPVAQPVAVPSGSQKVVHEDVQPTHNYMATVALSALMGGVAGLLVGGAIYYLDDGSRPRNIGFWAAGGVLAGTAIGIAQVMVQEDRASRAVGYLDPAPTARLALVNARF